MTGNQNLYQNIKNQICDQIFEGQYQDGDKIPPERELAESLGVSRVTVRKSLELLEEEQMVVREVGRGTRVSMKNYGNVNDLDMIVLIAPAKNPFFSKFIACFQEYAERQSSMLLYVEKPKKEELEHCLYRLYKRGLRNVVIWLEDLPVNQDKLMRLRAIGMNMVFFDSNRGLPYGDCVAVDNGRAIKELYVSLKKGGNHRIGYVGWDVTGVYSIDEREKAYIELQQKEKKENLICHISWKQKRKSIEMILETLKGWEQEKKLPEALICGDQETGKLVCEAISQSGYRQQIASMDELSLSGSTLVTCKQDLTKTVEQICSCFQNQCEEKENWKAKLHLIPGILDVQKS